VASVHAFLMGLTMEEAMKQMSVRKGAIAASVFACAAVMSFGWSEQGGVSLSIESAQARVGRPLTPMSVAGVGRRTARRAAIGTAAVAGGALAAGAYYGTQPYYGAGYAYRGGPYAAYGYGGWDEYARRNGIVCRPGTTFKGEDGRQRLCQ
jgi:hypothetical protein